jgi:hypothetical protein
MILVPFARVIIIVGVLAAILATPSRAEEKGPGKSKLVYRQIGAGWRLAIDPARQGQTFFLCAPKKTSCPSITRIGWRKPFILFRAGDGPGIIFLNTRSNQFGFAIINVELPRDLQSIVLDRPADAWEKLSPTKRLW